MFLHLKFEMSNNNYPVFTFQTDTTLNYSDEKFLDLFKKFDERGVRDGRTSWYFPRGGFPPYYVKLKDDIGEKIHLEITSPHPKDSPKNFPKELTDILNAFDFKMTSILTELFDKVDFGDISPEEAAGLKKKE